MKIYYIDSPSYTGRIRARRAVSRIDDLAREAAETGKPRLRVAHGGDVCNSYGYPAQTEALVEVAFPPDKAGVQRAIIYRAQLPANKVTLGGAAQAAAGYTARLIWDRRYTEHTREKARKDLVREARAAIGRLEGGEEVRRKKAERDRRRLPRPFSLQERLLLWRAMRAWPAKSRGILESDLRCKKLKMVDRWLTHDTVARPGSDLAYVPYGDNRDADAFAAETNQERRRLILAACGRRVLRVENMTLVHEDEYGRLYDTGTGLRAVLVRCPSTGAEYLLPVQRASTAHEAVASTFGLRAEEYRPIAQA